MILYMKVNHPVIFKDCDKDTMDNLVKRILIQVYKPGDILVRKQTMCTQLMMISEGKVISTPQQFELR